MAVLLTVVFVLTVGFIWVANASLEDQLAPLVAGIESNEALTMLLIESAAKGFFISVALLAVVFLAVGHFIARPIRHITQAMTAFAESGVAPSLSEVGWAPKEVQTLVSTFAGFAGSVEEVHKHDVEISRVKSDFISTAAHQLRTPLTGIRWALEALALEPLTENQKALVASATEKSHQLVAVVGTLLDISSIESGKYKYTFTTTNLDELVAEVAHDFEPLAVKSGVSLIFQKTGEVAALVRADRERIRWVLNNLIENAIRYTPKGGAVNLSTTASGDRGYVRVRDTGIGIDVKDRNNIFERFYRAPNAIAKENAGNGLGLYIARTIATDHGGDLNFEENKNGPGTTFTLTIPLAAK